MALVNGEISQVRNFKRDKNLVVHSLVVFDELVKSEQTPIPAPTVL